MIFFFFFWGGGGGRNRRRLCINLLGHTLQAKHSAKVALPYTISKTKVLFEVYKEIQDGHQKWPTIFGKNQKMQSPTLYAKILAQILLHCTVNKMYSFLCCMQKFNMAIRNATVNDFQKLLALHFLPHEQIPPTFHQLKGLVTDQIFTRFMDYIERQWI